MSRVHLYNPGQHPYFQDATDQWKRELANEAGMLHGVEAYNEVLGQEVMDLEEYEWENGPLDEEEE